MNRSRARSMRYPGSDPSLRLHRPFRGSGVLFAQHPLHRARPRILMRPTTLPFVAALALLTLSIAPSDSIRTRDTYGTRGTPVAIEEDFRFQGGGLTLAGSLVLPPGEGPHPAIVLTHGSEAGTRRGYRVFVQLFIEQGIAVMRYDKRGVGDSEGRYVEAPDLRQPCADLLGAVAFLRSHPSIDGEHIGVFGASQGGWVGPMAASMSEHITFVCVQSAPGVSPLEQNLYDKGNRLRTRGLSDADVARATEYRRAFWGYLVTGEGYEEAARLRGELSREPWFTPENFPYPFERRETLLRHPRLQSWTIHSAYEPRLTLERVRVPLLAVYGGDDSIVPVEESIARFRAAFAVSGNEHLTVKVFEGADHGVRVIGADGERRIAPGYFELMGDWAARQAFGID